MTVNEVQNTTDQAATTKQGRRADRRVGRTIIGLGAVVGLGLAGLAGTANAATSSGTATAKATPTCSAAALKATYGQQLAGG